MSLGQYGDSLQIWMNKMLDTSSYCMMVLFQDREYILFMFSKLVPYPNISAIGKCTPRLSFERKVGPTSVANFLDKYTNSKKLHFQNYFFSFDFHKRVLERNNSIILHR